MNRATHLRKLVWYQRFRDLLQFLHREPTVTEIMFEVFDILDRNKAFGYEHVAYSAHRSLIQVLNDHGYRVR